MVSLEYGPGRASTEPKRLGLLVECEETVCDKSVAELPDLVRLSRFEVFIVSLGTLARSLPCSVRQVVEPSGGILIPVVYSHRR
jgi:hypothetical protein